MKAKVKEIKAVPDGFQLLPEHSGPTQKIYTGHYIEYPCTVIIDNDSGIWEVTMPYDSWADIEEMIDIATEHL